MKRAIDFCLALICIIIFSPLFIICYLAIRWEDRGPAFFKQERIGLGGKPFNILKFRSMPTDDNRDEFALFNHNKHENLTRIGRFLRDHHLDELPQLICHLAQWVYRHHGEDARATGNGPVLFRA